MVRKEPARKYQEGGNPDTSVTSADRLLALLSRLLGQLFLQ